MSADVDRFAARVSLPVQKVTHLQSWKYFSGTILALASDDLFEWFCGSVQVDR